ncbi:MAG: autotransporter-associated beta strand repeat-containing protein, partial [Verrucomicrobiae bacterium]|nr:autotransporter-associated beta strand repeat-containing protein [Verrucomicrobiae bacterium]
MAFSQTVVINQSFKSNSASGWIFEGTGGYTPFLTATNGDSDGTGWLRMTDLAGTRATSARYGSIFDSANTTIKINFDFAIWSNGGIAPGRADGIGFYLYDGSATFSLGQDGGSLGYANKNGNAGMNGGYLGIGIDQWGNYSAATEGKNGGAGFLSNAVAVRGPGQGNTGYEYLAGSGSLTTNMDFDTYTARPTNAVDARSLEILITRENQLTVSVKFGTNAYQELFTADLSGYTRPSTLGMGFFAGTGGAYQWHDLRNIEVTNQTAHLWDNDSLDSLWGTATNWVGDVVPQPGADILFDNTYVSTAQFVNMAGTTRTNRVIEFDAPFGYTVSNGTLRMDAVGNPGQLYIRSSKNNGDSAHTISANVVLTSNLFLQSQTSNALTLSGVINNGGWSISNIGSGLAVISGRITNTGGIVQSGTNGTLILSGSNSYSGGTVLNAGTIAIGNSNALGTGLLSIYGGTLSASGGAQAVSNNINLLGDVTIGGSTNLTLNGALTNNGANRTITINNASNTTFGGNILLSENNTGRTLIFDVGNNSTGLISGVIQNGGTGAGNLTKNGQGVLTLGASNIFTGTTTVSNGTLGIQGSDRLHDSSDLNLAGGTFNLNGTNSERIDQLSYNNGTLDFGASGTANNFLISNAGTGTGNLYVQNWQDANTDRFAVQTVNSNLGTAYLNGIYFSGYGSGAMVTGANQTVGSYGSTWSYIVPTNIGFNIWDGGAAGNDWNASGGSNWVGNVVPPDATGTRISMEGIVRTNGPVVNSDVDLNTLKFNTNAGLFNITDNGGGASRLDFGGTLPSIMQLSTNNQIINAATRFNSTVIIDIAGTGNLTISDVIQNAAGGINKIGTGGKLILTSANSFNGNVDIIQGTINAQNATALGNNSQTVTVRDGSTLELQGGITLGTYTIAIQGAGVGSGGAIRNISGNNANANAITLNGDTRINSDAGTLTLSGDITGTGTDITLGGAGNVTISSTLNVGTGNLVKDGTGTVTLSGGTANTTGLATVTNGTLVLNKTAGVNAIGGNLSVGGAGQTSTVTLLAANQIADTATVTLNAGGILNLSNNTETVSVLNSSAGSLLQLGGGAGGSLTISSTVNSLIAGNIAGTGDLIKSGTGKLTLTASNSYTGATTINAGILNIQNSNALGATNGATTVNSGASLEVEGGVLVVRENLTLNGTGLALDGALRNLTGSNTWSGTITAASAARIHSDTGLLTLNGTITSVNQSVTMGG